ncbi:MAG TPA: transcriptional regulator GcvA [Casimicrobiaceae bacterium]|nr:transcriptional regulator GcvA [Casimicrobiaceae bacterium]
MDARIPATQALRALEAVARTGSLTKAAEAMHLTHGAISHQLKGLEEELGVRLIERAGRGIRLTDEGERFAGRVRAALGDLAEAVREITEHNNPRQFRVSVMPSFAARWLLPRIGRFLAENPDIDLDVRATMSLVDFRRDDVEAALRYGGGHYPGIVSEHLLDDVYYPVCSPRLGGGRRPSRPEELSRYLLLRSDNEFWQPWFRAAGLDWPEPTRGPIYNDASHLMQAAVDGQGIALARSSLIGNDIGNGVLVRLFDIEVPSPFHYYLVYPPRLAQSPKLHRFRAWLQEEVARDAKTPHAHPKTVAPPAARSASSRKRR